MPVRADLPFTVIGGYLGAGKTTLVNELLRDPRGRRFGVVVNDIGEIDVDAALIDVAETDMVTLGNGCVCCSAVDGFQTALATLLEPARGIDHVVVEVSGVGDPWKVAQWGRTPGFELDAVIVLADAEQIRRQAADRYIGETVLTQLAGADLVVVTKADLVPGDLVDVLAWIGDHCEAPMLCPDRGSRSIAELLSAARAGSGAESPRSHAHHRTWKLGDPAAGPRDRWKAWLGAAPTGVMRAKGFVDDGSNLLLVQLVGRRGEVTRWRGDATIPGLVVVATLEADEAAVEAWLQQARCIQQPGERWERDERRS